MASDPPDPYAILGLTRDCSEADIREAYRALARLHHPDLNPGDPAAVAHTQALNAAYEILRDPMRRRAHDRATTMPDPLRVRPARRPAIRQVVLVAPSDLLQGATRSIRLPDASTPPGTETLDLIIPPGTAPGTLFRLRRAPPHERVVVTVRVKLRPDPRLKARGADVQCDLRLPARRAAEGGWESVRALTGRPLRVRVPPGVTSGTVLRISGEGLPAARGGRGDLLVRILHRPDAPRAPRRQRL